MGESRTADIRTVGVKRDVDDFGDVMGDRCELSELEAGEDRPLHFQNQVRQDARQISIAGALSVTIHTALDLAHTRFDGSQGRCHGASGVIVKVNPDLRTGDGRCHLVDDIDDLAGKVAAVGVA